MRSTDHATGCRGCAWTYRRSCEQGFEGASGTWDRRVPSRPHYGARLGGIAGCRRVRSRISASQNSTCRITTLCVGFHLRKRETHRRATTYRATFPSIQTKAAQKANPTATEVLSATTSVTKSNAAMPMMRAAVTFAAQYRVFPSLGFICVHASEAPPYLSRSNEVGIGPALEAT